MRVARVQSLKKNVQNPILMPGSVSNVIWSKRLVGITGGYDKATVLNDVLSPVGRLGYKAEGEITLVSSPVFETETICPMSEMWVLNEAGFAHWRSGQMPPKGLCGAVKIPTIIGQTVNFELHNFDYNGQYYFLFFALDNRSLLSAIGQHSEVRVTLRETWMDP
jgi:hypothetical protein